MLFCLIRLRLIFFFFFFNDTATTEIYTLSLHDALPISTLQAVVCQRMVNTLNGGIMPALEIMINTATVRKLIEENRRSEEHTSELQSRLHLVCRLLLEKKKKKQTLIQQQLNINNQQ